MVLMRDAWRCQLETYREALQLALLNRAARGGGWETEGGGGEHRSVSPQGSTDTALASRNHACRKALAGV